MVSPGNGWTLRMKNLWEGEYNKNRMDRASRNVACFETRWDLCSKERCGTITWRNGPRGMSFEKSPASHKAKLRVLIKILSGLSIFIFALGDKNVSI